jgi:hypothetical protein
LQTAPPDYPEEWAQIEKVDVEADIKKRRKLAEIAQIESDTILKESYADKIFTLVSIWLGSVFLVVLFQGFGAWGWKVSDNVLISLVAGATTGVIGLLAAVLAYVFRAPKPKK